MAGSIDQLSGSESVLLVEDEPHVRLSMAEVLRSFGYTVIVAATGEEAINVYRQLNAPVDLIITDIVLPSMSGPHLVASLHSAGARFKLIYMSGYTEDRLLREEGFGEDVQFLQKPFSATGLLTKVREVLDAR